MFLVMNTQRQDSIVISNLTKLELLPSRRVLVVLSKVWQNIMQVVVKKDIGFAIISLKQNKSCTQIPC